MGYFFGVMIFFLGAAVGSFVNVIVDRYNTGLLWFKGRSICFSCSTELENKDLIPIFSFIFLRRKCRHCGSKIPVSVFITEILMGVFSVLAALKSGVLDFSIIHNSYFIIQGNFFLLQATNYLLLLFIFAVILAISLYDLKHFIIPDSFLVFLFVLAFLHNSLFIIHPSFSSWLLTTCYLLLSGLVLALPFLFIFIISKGTWFGFGDVKYIAVLGFFFGLAQGASAVTLAFWVGAIYALLAIFLKKIAPNVSLPLVSKGLTIKSEVPFGPFLSLGAVLGLLWSFDLFHIYEIFS